ncbi:menaquinone biosynthetic enzyme MqnA/MqnD family protein [Ferruginibacter sp. SUN002]|uniref:menaquinone biosynthetic enzyme MqnA/MqnD family protein n=1 Tax=Ferruginibacter sp. SUN002 TaxID=2937789 RepID=UPI003D359D93
MEKIRVGAVSYLNTKPLVYGLELGMMSGIIDIVDNYPSNIADALLNNEIDIALLPVAVIPMMVEYHVIGNHCISCDGAVDSVCLFSEVPLEQIKIVLLDYQSRTSVELVKLLCKEFWKIDPIFEYSRKGFENAIAGTTAALVIGDRALQKKLQTAYEYDLGLAWKQYTGLPFVFAVWVSNKQLSNEFIKEFIIANNYGLQNIDQVIAANPSPHDLAKYYTQNIHYVFNSDKRKGLETFLGKIAPDFNLKIDA